MYFADMSRNPSSDPDGKLTERIDFLVSEPLKNALGALAVVSGYGSTGEYLRAVLNAHAFGHLPSVQKAYRHGAGASPRGKGEE